MLCVMMCVMVCVMLCVMLVCDVGVCGGVELLILCCLGVLVTHRRTDGRTDIGGCRVAFANDEYSDTFLLVFITYSINILPS